MIFYTCYYLDSPISAKHGADEVILIGLIGIFWLMLMYDEAIQKFSQEDYFSSLYNKMDVIQFTLSAFIMSSHMGYGPFEDINVVRIVSAFVVILLWIKICEVLRVIRIFSFYIKLIIETIREMAFFVFVMLTILVIFTTATYVAEMSAA